MAICNQSDSDKYDFLSNRSKKVLFFGVFLSKHVFFSWTAETSNDPSLDAYKSTPTAKLQKGHLVNVLNVDNSGQRLPQSSYKDEYSLIYGEDNSSRDNSRKSGGIFFR